MSSKGSSKNGKNLVSVSARDLHFLTVVSVVTLATGLVAFILACAALQSLDTGQGLAWLRLFTPVTSVVDLLLVLAGGVLLLVLGALGLRTANNPAKIVPCYWMSLVLVAFEASDLLARIAAGVPWLNVMGLALSVLCLVLLLRLKKQLTAK